MRIMFRAVFVVLALMLGSVTMPAVAEGLQSAVMTTDTGNGSAMPVIFKSNFRDMKVEEIAAIAAGAAVVGTAADLFFNNGWITVIAIAGGAALGSYWYEQELWPFHE